jgi:hypothetical protein
MNELLICLIEGRETTRPLSLSFFLIVRGRKGPPPLIETSACDFNPTLIASSLYILENKGELWINRTSIIIVCD